MASRYEVEVTLSSAKDLKNINWRYGPIRPYVIVWINPDRKVTSRTDDEGDTSPQWNQTLMVPLDRPIEEATLCIDVVHHASAEEDIKPLIGSTKVELRDIVDDVGIGALATRNLKLKRPSGRPHGKLELEITVRNPQYHSSNMYPAPQPVEYRAAAAPHDAAPPSGYPYNSGYGQPTYEYGQPTRYGYEYEHEQGRPVEEKKKSGFGGMGTGLAIGAAAGLVGGIALAEGYDALEDHIVDEAAEQVEDDLGGDDDDY
ncbi:uncharacterized protein LOC104888395 [Beta vulgaris subsp. vulgaris]|uniref:uncharacterized protein LOC104888395 n=1 Tax=Beta vulgaris subsp. vulgaris TaxID=3555 RepID=UPI002036B35A|nr:uncharacterized protein LOC104888395 [Beta vulgaris subsp. vulgaris]